MNTYILRPDRTRDGVLRNVVATLERLPATVPWAIEIKRHVAKRSDPQNRYLWGVAYATLQQQTGQSADDWHDYFLGEFFGWERYELFGRTKLRPLRRSSKLSKVEFAEYVDFILARAAENGVVIPLPNEMEDAA